MFGNRPPWAMVTPDNSLFNSSSFLMANCKCLGMIRDFLLSRAALPANSKTSAAKYSMTAAKYTGAPAHTTDRELESGTGRPGLGFASSAHDCSFDKRLFGNVYVNWCPKLILIGCPRQRSNAFFASRRRTGRFRPIYATDVCMRNGKGTMEHGIGVFFNFIPHTLLKNAVLSGLAQDSSDSNRLNCLNATPCGFREEGCPSSTCIN
ncbi:hypothetical protein AGLY_000133 [Aphis glycines]|uniref:Uncharacterized protein n=1 Tax=Aphis glycines TaxID=307491 RepID=A0A6G0U640_APHGL|nr:hypothetical protein AGLY_000133 [Aphis glycines]